MKITYIYLHHDGMDFYLSDQEKSQEELYCSACDAYDTLLGVYDSRLKLGQKLCQLFRDGYDLMPCENYDEIKSEFYPTELREINRIKEEKMSLDGVGLFFCVEGEFLWHMVSLESAEHYGDFLVGSESHFEVWENWYHDFYQVDYDYYPRGRVVYRKSDGTYLVYYDRCIEDEVKMQLDTVGSRVVFLTEEHYQCHKCNKNYVL